MVSRAKGSNLGSDIRAVYSIRGEKGRTEGPYFDTEIEIETTGLIINSGIAGLIKINSGEAGLIVNSGEADNSCH